MSNATVADALGNLVDLVEGDGEYDDAAYEKAMELGLRDEQKAVAEQYAGEGPVEVDESRIPTLGDKLAANAKIPKSLVLDGTQFVVKTSAGAGSSRADSEWTWFEDGFKFTFLKHDEKPCAVSIREVEV